jgi:hypothetical protein
VNGSTIAQFYRIEKLRDKAGKEIQSDGIRPHITENTAKLYALYIGQKID